MFFNKEVYNIAPSVVFTDCDSIYGISILNRFKSAYCTLCVQINLKLAFYQPLSTIYCILDRLISSKGKLFSLKLA